MTDRGEPERTYVYPEYTYKQWRREIVVDYYIIEYSYPDKPDIEPKYDYRGPGGLESDEWFESFEDAEDDVRRRLDD